MRSLTMALQVVIDVTQDDSQDETPPPAVRQDLCVEDAPGP